MKSVFQSILAFILGIFFILAGGQKLLGQEEQIDNFFRWGYPLWFLYLIGSVELICGVGLLFSQIRPVAILVLSVTMVGASLTHLYSGEMMAVPVPLFILVLLLLLAGSMRASAGKV